MLPGRGSGHFPDLPGGACHAAKGGALVRSRVRLAVGIPQTFGQGPVDTRKIREFLTRAEALGFESAWVVEQVLGSIPSLEPVELLAYAAAVTERIINRHPHPLDGPMAGGSRVGQRCNLRSASR